VAGSGDASDARPEEALAGAGVDVSPDSLTRQTSVPRARAPLTATAGDGLRRLVTHLPKPRRLVSAWAPAFWRRTTRSADRWLPGWPVLRLPTGEQDRFTIGRELACDMTLANVTVSRWHATLQRRADGWLLSDLGSTNGTRLNGWRVSTPSRVGAGDVVSFGAATFVLVDRPG
jgi:Inner membrane component of T3SS, cytoplasmic domain